MRVTSPQDWHHIHTGTDGDILKVDPNDLEVPDFLVAGGDCRPFSSIGLKKGGDDLRSEVFWRLGEWGINFAHRGTKWVSLEMVVKALQRCQGREPFALILKARLEKEVPFFKWWIWTLHLPDFGIPHNRNRMWHD